MSAPSQTVRPREDSGRARPGTFALLATVGVVVTWAANALGALPDPAAFSAMSALVLFVLVFGLRQGFLDRDLSRRLAVLGGPVVVAMVSQNLVNIVDNLFVGQLPSEVAVPGVAALGMSLPVLWLVGGFLSAIGIGTQAITARRHAEREEQEAGRTLNSAAAMAFVLGVGFSIIGYFLLPLALPLLNSNASVLEQAVPFARVRYIGIASMVITATYKAFFDATGRTYVHMVAAIVMNVVNMFLCWALILGNAGFPRLEVAGAAWASTLSSVIGTLVMIGWTLTPSMLRRYRLYRPGSFSWATARSIVRLSLPSGAATVIGMLGFLLFLKAVSAVDAASGSPVPVNASATGLILQIVLLFFLVAFAFGTATSALLSQALGAKDPQLAQRFIWESVKLGTLLMVLLASVLFIFPEEILGAFLHSKELGEGGKAMTIAAGAGPLRLMAVAATTLGAGVIFIQSLYGAGNTKFVMVVEGALHFGCLVPLSWLFGVALGFGLMGVWAAAALYIVLLAAIMGWKIHEGSWKQIRL